MTDEEFAQWGVQESKLREADMQGLGSRAEFDCAKAAASARRLTAGLSRPAASRAVIVGLRIRRGECWQTAMSRP